MKLDIFLIGTTIGAQKCPEDIIKRLFKISINYSIMLVYMFSRFF